MKRTTLKVGAFIVRDNGESPPRLLLFTQPDSKNAPIQIPGGTVEPDEPVETALWRELCEETGLTNLKLLRKIGVSKCPHFQDGNEILERHCYLLSAPREAPDQWIHLIGGEELDGGMRFAFAWRPIESDFTLPGDLGAFLNPQDLPELYGASSSPCSGHLRLSLRNSCHDS